MFAASHETCPKCLIYTVTITSPFAEQLLTMDSDIEDLLITGIQTFLAKWLTHVYVLKDDDQPNIKLFIGVCWYYLESTKQLQTYVCDSITNYLDSFLKDYCSACGVGVSTADLDQVFVNCVSD